MRRSEREKLGLSVRWGMGVFWIGFAWFGPMMSWDYAPVPKKVALTVAAVLMPWVVVKRENWGSWVLAGLVVVLTWWLEVVMWVMDRKPYGV